MMRFKATSLLLAICLTGILVSAGCVQAPTEKQSISDLRPQISFKTDGEKFLTARIQLDGLDVGMVSEYIDGASAMRIRPGTHIVRIVYGPDILLEEKFYLGDGANRTFIVR